MNEPSSHYPGLSGRIAVVTGASGAIGGAVCRALARQGTAVAASGRSADALEHLVSEIRSQGGSAVAVTADVTDPDALEKLRHETQTHLGPIDFVAAVAGGGGEPVALSDMSLDRWRQTIDLNLTSAFLTLKTFLPSMAERGRGAVVTVASLAGQHVCTAGESFSLARLCGRQGGLVDAHPPDGARIRSQRYSHQRRITWLRHERTHRPHAGTNAGGPRDRRIPSEESESLTMSPKRSCICSAMRLRG